MCPTTRSSRSSPHDLQHLSRPAPLRPVPLSGWLRRVQCRDSRADGGGIVADAGAHWLPLWVAAMAASGTLPPSSSPPRRGTRRHPRSAEGDAGVPGGDGDRHHRYSARLPRVAQPTAPLGLGLLLGVGVAFNLPAWQAMVPDLVPAQLVANAVALNSVAFNVARAVGPALGGLLVAPPAPGGPFSSTASSGGDRRRGPAPLVRPPSPRSSRWHRPSGSGSATPGSRHPSVASAAAMFALTSGVVQSLLATLTAESLDAGAFAYGVARGDGARLCWAPSPAVPPPSGWQSVMSGWRSPPSDWPASPASPGVWLAGVALFIAGSPGCGPWRLSTPPSSCSSGVGQRPGGLPLHLGLRRRPPAGSSTGRLDRVGLRNPSRLCGAGDGTVVLGLVIPTLHLPTWGR